jgi:hypothetical protein
MRVDIGTLISCAGKVWFSVNSPAGQARQKQITENQSEEGPKKLQQVASLPDTERK